MQRLHADVAPLPVADAPYDKGDRVTDQPTDESLMNETGLGLLPGLCAALGLVLGAMTLLLTGVMWAVVALLALALIVTAGLVTVVIALLDEGERGRRLRRVIPGLDEPPPGLN
jgi:hypothetical protein